MNTFTFLGGSGGGFTRSDLLRQAERARSLLPTLNRPLETGARTLEEGFGWWWLTAPGDGAELVSECVTERWAAVVFGEIRGAGEGNPAERVVACWRADPAAARELDGSFSAVVVEKATGEVHLFGDLLGQRALRYFATEEQLVASPHDLCIAATGTVSGEIDVVSGGSIMAAEWSLGGRSLVRGVERCAPFDYVRWSQGEKALVRSLGSLRSPPDGVRTEEIRKEMLDTAVASCREFLRGRGEVIVDVTAGRDSRAALALVLGARTTTPLRARCEGEEDSLDVGTGRRLAERHGLRFSAGTPTNPTPEHFLEQVDLMAFAMNGDTNSKRALMAAPTYPERRQPHIWGGGGEIYRGYWYPRATFGVGLDSMEEARQLLRLRLRTNRLPWASPELPEAVGARQEEAIHRLERFARDPYDLLDLYYLFERFAVWGSMKERFTWEPDVYWSPFVSPRLVRTAFRLPPPIGDHSRLHLDAIRRFMPTSYWTPVNAASLLPFDRLGRIGRVLNRSFYTLSPARRRAAGRKGAGARSHDQIRAEIFGGPLADLVTDLMLQQGSLSTQILGRSGAERLVQSHRQEPRVETGQLLGYLVSMERWLHLLKLARR